MHSSISQRKPKIIAIVGPTASGKTDLAIKLAKKFNGEIVSADSRQVYREMDIGTAKPKLVADGIPHHLLDIKNPNEPYTVADYKRDALKAIRAILKRGKLPILVGGTGLYVNTVTENLDIPKVKPNPQLRRKLEIRNQKYGTETLFEELLKLDPEAAYVVDPKNPRRVIRALEVALTTGKPFTAQRRKGKLLFKSLKIDIALPKEKLRERINKRVDEMIKKGLILEVNKLIGKYGPNCPAFDAIGYREIIVYLQMKIPLPEAIEQIKKNTWRFARRQLTWFRKDKEIKWIRRPKEATKLALQFLKKQFI